VKATSTAESVPEPENLIDLLEGDLDTGRRSPLYTLGALVVAIMMIILPVIYLVLIAAVGYLTFLHAVDNVGILEGGGTRGRLLAYLGPLIAGIVVCFFLIKPLFARPMPRPEPISLDREHSPLLFAWVERLCGMVGAPLPRRIDVNCDVNASASFEGGLWGMIRRNMVLTIGLPLVGGMTLTQFTGILAHEFGHFAQGGAMRLSYIIRSVNYWFARVVHERDEFDVALDEAQASGAIAIMIVALVAKGGVWLSRRVLWVLMMTGNLFSTFLLRQMEYDADRYEAKLVGSDTFRATAAQLHRLMVGHNQAMSQVNDFWKEKKLPDNLPAVCLANTESLDDQAMEEYIAKVFEVKTDRWSTHPSDRDRIEHTQRMDAPGILYTELPADILLRDIEGVSLQVTEAFYRFQMGGALDMKHLWPTRELLTARNLERDRMQGTVRFLQGRIDPQALFFPLEGGDPLPSDVPGVLRELEANRAEFLAAEGESPQLRNELLGRRLQLSLHLRTLPEFADNLDDLDENGTRAEALTRVMECLRRVYPLRDKLEETFQTVLRELEILQNDQENKIKRYAFEESLGELHVLYMKIRDELEPVPYPFSHAEGEISCADYAAKGRPKLDEVGLLFDSVQGLLGHFGPLYVKTVSRLIEMAESAEDSAGLERLKDPVIEEGEGAGVEHDA
jgi:Zn-dependent protease with chaperone function